MPAAEADEGDCGCGEMGAAGEPKTSPSPSTRISAAPVGLRGGAASDLQRSCVRELRVALLLTRTTSSPFSPAVEACFCLRLVGVVVPAASFALSCCCCSRFGVALLSLCAAVNTRPAERGVIETACGVPRALFSLDELWLGGVAALAVVARASQLVRSDETP